jgi:hypothetical protein
LRAADLVRYDTDGKQVRYWLKHKRDTSKLLNALETIVHFSRNLAEIVISTFREFSKRGSSARNDDDNTIWPDY